MIDRMTGKSTLTPEQRVKLMCDLSNTALAIFLSSVKQRFPDFNNQERKNFLIKMVVERERNRRI